MPTHFRTAKQRHIAALLKAKPLGAAEIRAIVGGDKTTLRRGLERLRDQGLLDYVDSDVVSAPGRPAGMWSLTTAGRKALDAASGDGGARSGDRGGDEELEDAAAGALESGQSFVRANVPRRQRRIVDDVLAHAEFTAASAWIARLDGDSPQYLIVFDRVVGEQPIENLVAALEAIGVETEVGSVRSVRRPDEFMDLIRTAKAAGERALESRPE